MELDVIQREHKELEEKITKLEEQKNSKTTQEYNKTEENLD